VLQTTRLDQSSTPLQMLDEKSVTPGKHLVHDPNLFSNDQVKNLCPNLYKKTTISSFRKSWF